MCAAARDHKLSTSQIKRLINDIRYPDWQKVDAKTASSPVLIN